MLTDSMHIKQTQAFIDQNPVSITVHRFTEIADGRGGRKKDAPRVLEPQVVRKVGSSRLASTRQVTTPDGSLVIPTAAIVAMPDADLEVEDQFEVDGTTFKVLSKTLDPPWRLQADVVEQS